jgi:transcriptional regulator with XRE-family HTH domain
MAERPTSQGFFLGEQLRRFRHARGLSLASVAAELGFSEAKLSRLEGGRTRLQVADMLRLLDFYGITDPSQRDYLINFTHQQEARSTGWWRERAGLHGGNVPQYLALEAVASRMRNVEPTLVPGLLQTSAYARVALRSKREGPQLDRETEARLARRRRLIDGELDATFLVGETALALIPPEVAFEQLRLLIELAALPNVAIQLIPHSEIAYLTHGNPLVLLSMAEEGLPDVAYVEHWAGSFVVDDPADVDLCETRWCMIVKECLSRHDTIEWMRDLWRG